MKKIFLILCLVPLLFACQLVGPIFVEYNGVRMDVAKWINSQTFLSMQQKRSLAQLSRAQQRLVNIEKIQEHDKVTVSTQNAIAMHCANQHLSSKKIQQLQDRVFSSTDKSRILATFDQEFPKVKLDPNQIQCD